MDQCTFEHAANLSHHVEGRVARPPAGEAVQDEALLAAVGVLAELAELFAAAVARRLWSSGSTLSPNGSSTAGRAARAARR
jgi:hypothetical protein